MTVEAVLSRLQGVRRSGAGWMALCPAHGDRSPSLSVSAGRSGRVLLHCFGGCSAKRVCEALQIRVSDLFSEHRAARERKPQIVGRVEQKMTDLRSRLTPSDRERPVTIVLCDPANLEASLARALALGVEGELVQVMLDGEGQ